MSYLNSPTVLLPFLDEHSRKVWYRFSFKGRVAKKKLFAEMKKAVKKLTNVDVSKRWLQEHMAIIDHDLPDSVPPPSLIDGKALVDELARRLECPNKPILGDHLL